MSTPPPKSYFEEQRAALISEIAVALDHVLNNMNTLNRNLESVTAVGREFENVESLWAVFEGVMGKGDGKVAVGEEEGEGEKR